MARVCGRRRTKACPASECCKSGARASGSPATFTSSGRWANCKDAAALFCDNLRSQGSMRLVKLALFLSIALPLLAQSQLSTLSGTITDPSGAATPTAEVRIVNAETGEHYTAVANASGNYTF